MLDREGYRLNIGIILANSDKKLFWGKRIGHKDAWQFPQGGMKPYETLQEAMYRELLEEIGLGEQDVEIIAVTRRWLHYKLPERMHSKKVASIGAGVRRYQGQKQRWFLLKLISDQKNIHFDETQTPEFNEFKWVDYWYPLGEVIYFKRQVYGKVLHEFEGCLSYA